MRRKCYSPLCFQRNLKMLIRNNGFNATHIAKIIGCERKAVYGWYKGDTAPNVVHFMKLCEIFMIDPKDMYTKYLFEDEEDATDQCG